MVDGEERRQDLQGEFACVVRDPPRGMFCARSSITILRPAMQLQLWACNSTLKPRKAKIVLVSFDLHEGQVVKKEFKVDLAPNSSTEVWAGDVPGQPVRRSDARAAKPIVVQARLVDEDGSHNAGGEVLARYSNWSEPWKYLIFPDPKLDIQVKGDTVTLSCEKPIKGLVLDVEGEECQWSDQAIDLFPGDVQAITAKGLNGRKVQVRYLGDGTA